MSDLLAIIRTGHLNCFGRNANKHDAVRRARSEFVECAKALGGLKADSDIKVAIYELDGTSGNAWWDETKVYDEEGNAEIPLLEIEEINVTAKETKPRKRR